MEYKQAFRNNIVNQLIKMSKQSINNKEAEVNHFEITPEMMEDIEKMRKEHGLETDSGSEWVSLVRNGYSSDEASWIVFKNKGFVGKGDKKAGDSSYEYKGKKVEDTNAYKRLSEVSMADLDTLEIYNYNKFIKNKSHEEALQIIINTVEGDYSQLSDKLREIAQEEDNELGVDYNDIESDKKEADGDLTNSELNTGLGEPKEQGEPDKHIDMSGNVEDKKADAPKITDEELAKLYNEMHEKYGNDAINSTFDMIYTLYTKYNLTHDEVQALIPKLHTLHDIDSTAKKADDKKDSDIEYRGIRISKTDEGKYHVHNLKDYDTVEEAKTGIDDWMKTMKTADKENLVKQIDEAWFKMSVDERKKALRETGSFTDAYDEAISEMGGSMQDVMEDWVKKNKIGSKKQAGDGNGSKFKVHYTNHDYFSQDEFDTIDKAMEFGKTKGFEFTVVQDGEIVKSWSPISGEKSYNRESIANTCKEARSAYRDLGSIDDYVGKERDKYTEIANRLETIYSDIEDSIGINSRPNGENINKVINAIKDKIKDKVPAPVYLFLEDDNFHFLNEVLAYLDKFEPSMKGEYVSDEVMNSNVKKEGETNTTVNEEPVNSYPQLVDKIGNKDVNKIEDKGDENKIEKEEEETIVEKKADGHNYIEESKSDAKEFISNFEEAIVDQLLNNGSASTDLFNDYDDGDSFIHEYYTEKWYNLKESAEILDQLRDHEETDGGLWEGQEPRQAIATQAAFTYSNAVQSEIIRLIEQINDEYDSMADELKEDREQVKAIVSKYE